MKGKDVINHAARTEMPDMEQLRQNCIREATEREPVKRRVWVNRLVPITACAVLIVAMAVALPHLINTVPDLDDTFVNNSEGRFLDNGSEIPDGSIFAEPEESDTSPASEDQPDQPEPPNDDSLPPEFIGLPMTHHCLPPDDTMGSFASRMGVGSLIEIFTTPGRAVDFWAERKVQAFAFVRVIETTQEEHHQTSTVEVLRTVWSRERELPDTMTLTQFSGAIMCCSPYGELMREGGVFLLPLWYNDGTDDWREEGWYNWTYFDVLFEVDNNGLIWSRSNLSGFNRFDGRHTSLLENAILGIANGDENLGRDIAHSPLGWAADDSVLAIVTAVSSESDLLFPGSPGSELWRNLYIMSVEEILSTPTAFGLQRGAWHDAHLQWRENWQTSEHWWLKWERGSEIDAVTGSFSANLFEAGERYLVLITPSYTDWSAQFTFFWESAARINADGTITPIWNENDNWNVFNEYEGYTVERLAELAYLANTWHEVYSQ